MYIYVPTKLRTDQQQQNPDQQGEGQEGGRHENFQLQHTQDHDDTPQGTRSSVLHGVLQCVATRCSVLSCVAVFCSEEKRVTHST